MLSFPATVDTAKCGKFGIMQSMPIQKLQRVDIDIAAFNTECDGMDSASIYDQPLRRF